MYAFTLIAGFLLILGVETLMWRLFRKKAAGIILPHEVDMSAWSFLTFKRMRTFTIVHGCILMGVYIAACIYLW